MKGTVLLRVGLMVCVLCLTLNHHVISDDIEQGDKESRGPAHATLMELLAKYEKEKPETYKAEKQSLNSDVTVEATGDMEQERSQTDESVKKWPQTSKVQIDRSLKDTFLKFYSGAKKTYKKITFLPQTPIDVVRFGVMVAEGVNTLDEDSTFGVMTGSVTCLNIFCSPMSLVYYILFGLTYVENIIIGSKEGVETFNDQVLKRTTSLPMVGSATKVTTKLIDATVEPALESLASTTKTVFKPVEFAYNISLKIVNKCLDVKGGLLAANLLALIQDAKNGNKNLTDQLGELSEYFKEECGAILEKLPTLGNILNALKKLGADIGPDIANAANKGLATLNRVAGELPNANNVKKESTEKRGIESLSLYKDPNILAENEPMTKFLKTIYYDGIKKAQATLKLFEPIVKFFQSVKRAIDAVLDFEICISLGPFGKLLEVGLKVAAAVAEGAVEFANKLFEGDIVGAVGVLGATVKDVGNVIGNELKSVGNFVANIGEDALDALDDVGDAFVSVILNPEKTLNIVGNAVGNAVDDVGSALSSAGSKIKNFFSGKRKKRSFLHKKSHNYRTQSPNPEYYKRFFNISVEHSSNFLDRRSRGFSADVLEKLADFIKGGEVCITPRQVLNGLAALVDTILKPFEKIVSEVLGPVLSQLQSMFSSIFPDLGFLNKLNDVSIDILSVDDFTNMVNIFQDNGLYKFFKDASDSFSATCLKYIRGHVQTDSEYTMKEVLCQCVSGTSGCAKRDLEERQITTPECRYSGIPYQGTLSRTIGGRTCMRWDSQSPHSHSTAPSQMPEMSLTYAENYCRDRDESFKQPWCFTTDPSKRWEYCDVPLCEPACISSGKETNGKLTVTGSGYKCQTWKTQSPHTHTNTDSQFPERTLGQAENFCHNPDNKNTGPYCYTTNIGQTWDVCDVPMCDSYSTIRSNYKEYIHTKCDGNNDKTISNTNIKKCFEDCESSSNCKAFGYLNNKCWIKTQCLYSDFTFSADSYVYVKSESPGYELYSNQNCAGKDILNKNVANVKECAQMCDSIPRCVGFVKAGNKCYLKEYCVAHKLTSKSGTHAYIKDELTTYNKSIKLSCPGNDLERRTSITNLECAQICERNSQCVAYSRSGTTCWFKEKCDQVSVRTSNVYIKEEGRFSKYSDRDCPGNGLRKDTNVYSPQQCMHVCRSLANCAAFTLKLTETSGECYLKKRCYPYQLTIKVNHDTYIMDQAPNYNIFTYKDCPGNGIQNEVDVQNQVECATKCDNDPLCRGFRSRNNKCLLKHKCDRTSLNDSSSQDVYIKKSVRLFDRYSFKGCNGNDMKSLTSESLEGCASSCYNNALCVAFKYNIQTAALGKCFLKYKCDTTNLVDRNDGHLYVQKAATRYRRSFNRDCQGNNIGNSYITFPETCASDCYKRADCFGFLFRTTDSHCWLKSECKPSKFAVKSNNVAYSQKELLGFKLYEKKSCSGNDVSDVEVDGMVQCAALCHSVQRCVAVVIHRSTFKCWIKHNCDEKKFVINNNVNAYILQANRPHTIEAAHYKPTYQSSQGSDGYPWYAVDGNVGSHYGNDGCTHTEKSGNPYWSVDLGTTRTVHYVTIVNRGDCCGDRLHDFKVYGSPNNNPSSGKLCLEQWGSVVQGATVELKCPTPVDARFVIIQIPGSGQILALCEVGVYVATSGIDIVEIAKKKQTWQSSVQSSGSSSRAVDGNKNFKYNKESCTHTKEESNPWWSVDLKAARTIRFVTVYNRGDCCGGRLHDFKVYGSTSNNPSNTNGRRLCGSKSGAVGAGKLHTVRCSSVDLIVARYVIIQIPGNKEILTLCEVNVYVEAKTIVEVAKKQPTYQSSLFNIGYSEKAVDGKKGRTYSGDGCTETKWQKDPWWSVYLGGERVIRYLTIYNRQDCCSDRLKDFNVYGSEEYDPSIGNKQLCRYHSGSLGVKTLYCKQPVVALYLIIQIPGSNKRLTLCEVELFAN